MCSKLHELCPFHSQRFKQHLAVLVNPSLRVFELRKVCLFLPNVPAELLAHIVAKGRISCAGPQSHGSVAFTQLPAQHLLEVSLPLRCVAMLGPSLFTSMGASIDIYASGSRLLEM
jgi:hypothetical protein